MKWIRIDESGGMFTEVMDLGHVCIMRVYSWDCEKDEPRNIALAEIDRIAGQDAIYAATNG